MKRLIHILTMAVMLSLLLSGCGGQEDTVSELKNDADSAVEDVNTVSKDSENIKQLIESTTGEVELNIWTSDEDHDLTENIIRDFEASFPDISFKINLGNESEATVKDTILKDPSKSADVFAFVDDQLEDLVAAGALKEVDTFYTYDPSKENVPASVEAASVGDRLFAYPMTADNGYFLMYDKTVIGMNQSKSLEEIIKAAGKKDKKVGMHIANGWYLYSFFQGAGYRLKLNEDGSNECDWNTAGGTDVAEAVCDVLSSGVFQNMDDATMISALEEGKVAAIISGTWRVDDARKAWGRNFAATKLPTIKIGQTNVQMASFSGCKLVGVNPSSKSLGWAMLFAEYLTDEQNQIRRYDVRKLGPSNIVAQSSADVQSDEAIAALAKQSLYASPQRVGNNYWEASAALGQALNEGRYSKEELQQLLDEAVEKITAPPGQAGEQ